MGRKCPVFRPAAIEDRISAVFDIFPHFSHGCTFSRDTERCFLQKKGAACRQLPQAVKKVDDFFDSLQNAVIFAPRSGAKICASRSARLAGKA